MRDAREYVVLKAKCTVMGQSNSELKGRLYVTALAPDPKPDTADLQMKAAGAKRAEVRGRLFVYVKQTADSVDITIPGLPQTAPIVQLKHITKVEIDEKRQELRLQIGDADAPLRLRFHKRGGVGSIRSVHNLLQVVIAGGPLKAEARTAAQALLRSSQGGEVLNFARALRQSTANECGGYSGGDAKTASGGGGEAVTANRGDCRPAQSFRQAGYFYRNVAHSAANLFVRVASDLNAMFSVYFADDALWSGKCSELPPTFDLPHEVGVPKGKPLRHRAQGRTPLSQGTSLPVARNIGDEYVPRAETPVGCEYLSRAGTRASE